jgi:hypothetical protein
VPLDETDKKFFRQLDDPMPGQRGNALELLRERLAKKTLSFRDILHDIESADALRQHATDLENRLQATTASLQQYMQANAKARLRYLAAVKLGMWLRVYWRGVTAALALPAIALAGYMAYDRFQFTDGPAIEAFASKAAWGGEGWAGPLLRSFNARPYWIKLHYERNDSGYVNGDGRAIAMQCVRVFARPATQSFGEYVKPADPYWLLGGWLQWRERALACKPAGLLSEAHK